MPNRYPQTKPGQGFLSVGYSWGNERQISSKRSLVCVEAGYCAVIAFSSQSSNQ